MERNIRILSNSLASTSGRQLPCPRPSFPNNLVASRRRFRVFAAADLNPSTPWGNGFSSRDKTSGSAPNLVPPASLAATTHVTAPLNNPGISLGRNITNFPPDSYSAAQPEAMHESEPAASALQPYHVCLQGTIQKVHFRSEQTSYSVIRVALDPAHADKIPHDDAHGTSSSSYRMYAPSTQAAFSKRRSREKQGSSSKSRSRPVITVVGTLPKVMVGQTIELTGSWTTHEQYGSQFKAIHCKELHVEGNANLVAYLSGGIIPGVGPSTAKRLVEHFEDSILQVLDSDDAVDQLTTVERLGRSKAEKIKKGWDAGRDARLGSQFLRNAGIPAALAQRIAEFFTSETEDVVRTDPYAALGAFDIPLTMVDRAAAAMKAPPDLVSRAVAVIDKCLLIASEKDGHTYLPWSRLEREVRKLLDDLGRQHGNVWPDPELLSLVAQHMHLTGRLIAEPSTHSHTDSEPLQSMGTFSNATSLSSASTSVGGRQPFQDESSASVEEIKIMMAERLSGASSQQLNSLFDTHGTLLPAVLDLPSTQAVRELIRCKRIGPKTAEKLKAQWDASAVVHSSTSPTTPSHGSTQRKPLASGLQTSDLEINPPKLPFEWGPDVKCYLPRLHMAEMAVTQAVIERASISSVPSESRKRRIKNWIKEIQKNNEIELSEGQCFAIEAASDAPLLVITGGPGCGKTTVVQAIVKLWSAQGKMVHVCAPTGRAAQRMGVIQIIEPSTIHRLLRFQPRKSSNTALSSSLQTDMMGGGRSSMESMSTDDATASGGADTFRSEDDIGVSGGFFELGTFNKLTSDAVLVDEASMLNLPLAAALMQALHSKTQLILVGDVDQLPPIGPGGVLHSLIQSGLVPVIDLREIFRQAAASAIVTSALDVRQGIVPQLRRVDEPTQPKLLNSGSDALLVSAPHPDAVSDLVYKTVSALADDCNFSESDLQVISPMRKGPTGSVALNKRLQELLNPPAFGKHQVERDNDGEKVFRVGDRVLQLINNYDKDVFNGDQGYVVAAYPNERKVVVEFPDLVGRGVDSARKEYRGVELNELELAYAVTVHKAQGGEAKHVVLALSPAHGRMLTRRLLYTSLTRAKDLLIVVAPVDDPMNDDPISTAVKNTESDLGRLSFLTQRLKAERELRGLTHHAPTVFSNEDEVLFQGYSTTDRSSAPKNDGIILGRNTLVDDLLRGIGVMDDEAIQAVVAKMVRDIGDDGDDKRRQQQGHNPTPSLVSVDTLQSYIKKLEDLCQNRGFGVLPPIGKVLQLAPLLLTASPKYFDQGLSFSSKLGPLTDAECDSGKEGELSINIEDSLVDQLRRVYGAAATY